MYTSYYVVTAVSNPHHPSTDTPPLLRKYPFAYSHRDYASVPRPAGDRLPLPPAILSYITQTCVI